MNKLLTLLTLVLCRFVCYANEIKVDSIKNPIGDVKISKEEDILLLKENYPNMDSIFGDLRFTFITVESPNIDLSFFQQIKYLEGDLLVSNCALNSLDDLINCTFSGEIFINRTNIKSINFLSSQNKFIKQIRIYDCDSLTDISAINNVDSINNLSIRSCQRIDSIILNNKINSLTLTGSTELVYLKIAIKNEADVSLDYNLNLKVIEIDSSVHTLNSLILSGNYLLTEIKNLYNLKSITNSLVISGSDSLKSIDLNSLKLCGSFSLSNKTIKKLELPILNYCNDFSISSCESLEEIKKFDNWKTCKNLNISNCNSLDSLDFLNDSLTITDRLDIVNNKNINYCNVKSICKNISSTKYIYIRNNGSHCENEIAVGKSCGFTSKCPNSSFLIHSDYDANLWNDNYSECKILDGGLSIENEFSITPYFPELENVKYDISILNSKLKDVNFPKLVKVYRISLTDNNMLETLSFPVLDSIDAIYIEDNINLSTINLTPQIDSMKIKSFLVQRNDKLISIHGLKGSNFCEGLTIRENSNLSKIEFLNFDFTMERLRIISNKNFKSCDSKAVCNHLADNKPYTIEFNDIESCNDSLDVIEACEKVLLTNLTNKSFINIYPNPTNSLISINHNLNQEFDFNLTDILGHNLLKGQLSETLDLSEMKNGLYLIRIINSENQFTFRIVKN